MWTVIGAVSELYATACQRYAERLYREADIFASRRGNFVKNMCRREEGVAFMSNNFKGDDNPTASSILRHVAAGYGIQAAKGQAEGEYNSPLPAGRPTTNNQFRSSFWLVGGSLNLNLQGIETIKLTPYTCRYKKWLSSWLGLRTLDKGQCLPHVSLKLTTRQCRARALASCHRKYGRSDDETRCNTWCRL